jgi:LacI family transcriptional regulator
VLSALHERGVRVPEELAVVGCDDLPVAAYTVPTLTTVHVPFYETGARAVSLLLEGIGGFADRGAEEQLPELLPVWLVPHGSSSV